MKNILITGVAGFLGSHLAKELLSAGHQVIGIDNLSTGSLNHVERWLNGGKFRFIPFDVSSPEVLRIPHLKNLDEIYHLASPASPKFYQQAPLETIAANTTGTKHMLDLALVHDANLLYSSTSEVYGDPTQHPQSEEYWGNVHTWGPRACYDESKRLGEVFCYEYAHRYKGKVRVARIFNTYSAGLRNDDGRVISNFVNQALSGDNLTVYGDGSQKRSFCYVDDTVRGLRMLMEHVDTVGQVVNIGNPEEHTIIELARLIVSMTRSTSQITFHPLPQDDPKQRRPVIDKAVKLGWMPAISLEEGLRRTIDNYRQQRKGGMSI